MGDEELDEDGELEADGVAVVFAELEGGAVDEEVEGVAEHVAGEGDGFVGFLVEEVCAFGVGVEVGGVDEFEVGLLEAVLRFEGFFKDGSGEEVAHF